MDIIHKVFVSSTYQDLREERAAVERTLLQLQCFPVGMEIFPAADDTAWDFIKSQIDDSDYYVLIVAARYGSIESTTGKSYTEMEYDYAVEKGVPVLAFVHGDPGSIHDDKRDKDPEGKAKLVAFREKVQKRLCRHWTSAKELQAEVATTLTSARNRYKREGFVRAGMAVDHKKMARLLEENRALQVKLKAVEATERTRLFAHGAEKFKVDFDILYISEENKSQLSSITEANFRSTSATQSVCSLRFSWSEILAVCGPSLLRGVSPSGLGRSLAELLMLELNGAGIKLTSRNPSQIRVQISGTTQSIEDIELQFRALGWTDSRPVEHINEFDGTRTRGRELYLTEAGVLEYAKIGAVRSRG